MRGLVIRFNESFITKVSSMPMALPWDNEEGKEAINAKKSFSTQMKSQKKIKMSSREKSYLTLG
jgi:hypothetical protein